MTRKKLITIISIIYIINGLWDIGIFLYPLATSSKRIEINLAPLISGVLALYIGFYLYKFEELGRKLAVFFLYIRVLINLCFIIWFITHREGISSSGLYFLEKEIYHIASPYASEIFLFISTLIALIMIVFLSQEKTKKLFGAAASNSSDVIRGSS